MQISRRNLVFASFIIITVVSSVFAASAAADYYQFYPSLAKIELSLTNLQISNNATAPYLVVKGFFSVVNPTDYKGFLLTIFRGSYEIDKNNVTVGLGANLPPPPGFITRSLDKNVAVKVFEPFNATNTGVTGIQVTFTIDLVLSTFLDGFGPIIVTFLCQGSGGPGQCLLAQISAQGSYPGQPRGNGGV